MEEESSADQDEARRGAMDGGRNENTARTANEFSSLTTSDKHTLGTDVITIVCECGDENCKEPFDMMFSQYEKIRSEPARFAVLKGHEILDWEHVIEEADGYLIVEKYGVAGVVAIDADPRHKNKTCRVVIVDDIFEIRVLLKMLLQLEPSCLVVGEASDGAEALTVVAQTLPEVVILDMEMPIMNGWTALPLIKEISPTTTVIVFSGMSMDERLRKRLYNLGASQIVRKGGDPTIIIEAAKAVAAGQGRCFGLGH